MGTFWGIILIVGLVLFIGSFILVSVIEENVIILFFLGIIFIFTGTFGFLSNSKYYNKYNHSIDNVIEYNIDSTIVKTKDQSDTLYNITVNQPSFTHVSKVKEFQVDTVYTIANHKADTTYTIYYNR